MIFSTEKNEIEPQRFGYFETKSNRLAIVANHTRATLDESVVALFTSVCMLAPID